MRWRSLGMAAVVVAAMGALAAPAAQAQEMDQCYDTRWGSMGCVRVEEFNFRDPTLARNSRYLLRGDSVYVTNAAMETTSTPEDAAVVRSGANRSTFRGEYAGQNSHELYCIVFARGC
jgi:hypothetical protein